MSGQLNIIKKSTFSPPPSGMLGYGFDLQGNPVRINVDGSTTLLITTAQDVTNNIIANKGVGLLANLPTSFVQNDIYVTTDSLEVYTAQSTDTWASTPLLNLQFVTDTSGTSWVLYQYDGTELKVVGDTIAPQAWIDFLPQDPVPSYAIGRIFYDQLENTWSAYNDIDGISLQLGEELRARLINDTGFDLLDGKAVSVKGAVGASLQVELLDASDFDSSIRAFGLMTNTTIDGNPGYAVRYGAVRGLNTLGNTAGALVYGDPDNPGEWTSVRPTAPNYPVRIGVFLVIDEFEGVIGVDTLAFNGTDTTVNIEGALNGIVTKKQSIDILVDTGIIYFETDNENTPTDDLPFIISEMRYFLNTTTGAGTGGKARVALTAGTATVPTTNYVYVLESAGAGVLTANTTGFPANSAPVAVVSVLDVTNTDIYGALVARRFNNAPNNGGGDGIFQYLSLRLRLEGSKYVSGVAPTVTITTNPSAIDGLKVTSTSGIVFQMHEQTFQAKDGTEYYVVNHPTTPYLRITDLSAIDVDANGDSLRGNNTRYGLNLFGGQNSANEIDRVYVMLPNGNYSTDANAINDASNYAVTSVPFELRGTAFRTFRIVVNYSTASSGTFTNLLGAGGYQDERGQPLGVGGGGAGSGAAQTNFSDTDFSVYNNTDATKIMQFLLSGLTTGNTRTLTVPDKDITIGEEIYEPTTEPAVVTGTPNELTLNLNNAKQAIFEPRLSVGTYTINIDFDVLLINDSNGLLFSVFFRLTGTRIISFESDVKVSIPSTIGSWDGIGKELTISAGTDDDILFVFQRNKTGSFWDLSVNEVSI